MFKAKNHVGLLSVILIYVLGSLGCGHSSSTKGSSNALWRIVSEECLIDEKQKKNHVNPCIEVNTKEGVDNGYVFIKDRRGVLQYLLMPTVSIPGIESSELLRKDSTNYFYLAWEGRAWMARKAREKIAPENASLAINSQYGRSQNHFHIHISCPKVDVQKQVSAQSANLKDKWEVFPEKINNHTYYAKKITPEALQNLNVFRSIADEIPDSKKKMGEFGVGLIAVKPDPKSSNYELVLLASRKGEGNRGSVEEIQDHDCPQIYKY